MPGAPTRQYLCKISHSQNPPKYMDTDAEGWKVDIDSRAWLSFLEKRSGIKPNQKPRKKHEVLPAKTKNKKKLQEEKPQLRDAANLQIQKLQEEIRKKQLENETLFLKLRKESGNVIDFGLAEYMFSGYLEKINLEKLRFPGKIEPAIEGVITDLMRSIKTGAEHKSSKEVARQITKLIIREEETIIRETKKAQADDIKSWREEENLDE